MRAVCLLLWLVAVGSGAEAQDQDEESKCCCTTYDMSVCLSKIHDKIDAELNTTYKTALSMTKKFGGEDVENLKDAERKWIAYRDAACKAEYGLWGGGSGGPNARTICVIRLTRQRIADLKSAYVRLNR
jgi:uncharacterized protein YecT (DUF1311 family)